MGLSFIHILHLLDCIFLEFFKLLASIFSASACLNAFYYPSLRVLFISSLKAFIIFIRLDLRFSPRASVSLGYLAFAVAE